MLWYLSFARETFRGACVIEADSVVAAVKRAHALGINPGGNVLGLPVPPDDAHRLPVGKLLSRADLDAAGEVATGKELEDILDPVDA